jgi:hypothetical protein
VADIMGTLGGAMGNAPMQHQDSLGGASVGRRTSFAQRVWAVAGARSFVQPSAVSSSPRAGIEGSGGGLGDRDSPGPPKISNCTSARCLRAHSAGGYGVYSMPRDPHSAVSTVRGSPARRLQAALLWTASFSSVLTVLYSRKYVSMYSLHMLHVFAAWPQA